MGKRTGLNQEVKVSCFFCTSVICPERVPSLSLATIANLWVSCGSLLFQSSFHLGTRQPGRLERCELDEYEVLALCDRLFGRRLRGVRKGLHIRNRFLEESGMGFGNPPFDLPILPFRCDSISTWIGLGSRVVLGADDLCLGSAEMRPLDDLLTAVPFAARGLPWPPVQSRIDRPIGDLCRLPRVSGAEELRQAHEWLLLCHDCLLRPHLAHQRSQSSMVPCSGTAF
ncbi:hypothetical protein BHE74_00019561 [Ensete ventricosum]|nr:hypothetical protein BHE74_00019561 [Ensete ventricosum]